MITRRKLFEMIPPVAAAVAVGAPLMAEASSSEAVMTVMQPPFVSHQPFIGDVIFASDRAYIWRGDRWMSEKEFIDRGGFSS